MVSATVDGNIGQVGIERVPNEVPSRSVALTRKDSAARKAIERRTKDLVLYTTQGGIPDHYFDWWADLRRGRLRIYGGLLRFIDLSVLRGVPKAILKLIPDWLSEYVDQQFEAK
jgi:hypothetical protein